MFHCSTILNLKLFLNILFLFTSFGIFPSSYFKSSIVLNSAVYDGDGSL